MKKIFSYDEAAALLPEVQRITAAAADEAHALPSDAEDEANRILKEWMEAIVALGAEVKGLWLVDFDCGSGYYCWRYPEPSLQFFHGYEEGFAGRVPMV